MLKIKKSKTSYRKIYFSSDFHYGHNKEFLYAPRGFKNSEDHSKWLFDQIDTLDPNDLLINVGDVGLSIGADAIQNFILRIPCETLMVWGNHSSGVYQLYKQHLPKGFEKCEVYPLRLTPNVTMLGSDFLLDIDHQHFYVRHMAPLIWEGVNKGRVAICGHSHGNLKAANPGENGIGKVLDVGVDNSIKYNGTAFFELSEVTSILNDKQFNPIDHHG